jgi:hypothetical protein
MERVTRGHMSECPKGEIPYVKGVAFARLAWRVVGRILVGSVGRWLGRWLASSLARLLIVTRSGHKKTPLISERGSGYL